MAWYNNLFTKQNPSQGDIAGEEGAVHSTENTFRYENSYENIEVVNRGCNMIVDDCAIIPVTVGAQTPGHSVVTGMRTKQLDTLLNFQPNLYEDINSFKRSLYIDILLDGNIFLYFDGSHLYHMPANKMVVNSSETTFVKSYTFNSNQTYKPDEIIHVKENSFKSVFRGTSRLKSAARTMGLMLSMRNFQDNFFKNGAVPGLVLKSPNTLSEKIKTRMILAWTSKFNPESGGRRPLILDGGMEVDPLTQVNFKDLDFQQSLTDNEKVVLKALGVPPILLDSGNNANIRPNLRLYHLETILPIIRKVNFALQRYFGFEITENTKNIPALQPELRDHANYWTSLVNGGVAYVNEARKELGLPEDPDPTSNELRIPANIAGSAVNPEEGGRPEGTEE